MHDLNLVNHSWVENPGVLFISSLDVSPAYMSLFSHVGILEVTSVGQNEVKGLLIQ